MKLTKVFGRRSYCWLSGSKIAAKEKQQIALAVSNRPLGSNRVILVEIAVRDHPLYQRLCVVDRAHRNEARESLSSPSLMLQRP